MMKQAIKKSRKEAKRSKISSQRNDEKLTKKRSNRLQALEAKVTNIIVANKVIDLDKVGDLNMQISRSNP